MATYPEGWPVCPACGKPALDGHITCGSFACGEHRFRRQRADEYRANKIREQRAYELTEDGMLFSVEPRIDFDWCKNNGEQR